MVALAVVMVMEVVAVVPTDRPPSRWVSVDLTTIHGSEPQVNSYPASEQRISEVERGLICNAVLPMPGARTLSAGDSIVFALAYLHAGKNLLRQEMGIRSASR